MFGKNPLRQLEKTDGQTLQVQGTPFLTIQGEGPFAGQPAVFVRLWGCSLKCFFCDTDFESNRVDIKYDELAKAVTHQNGGNGRSGVTNLVVVTGGEPLRQNLSFLWAELDYLHFKVQVETAGIHEPANPELDHWYSPIKSVTYICSPKTPGLNFNLQKQITAYKYIVSVDDSSDEDGLPIKSTQVEGNLVRLARPPKDFDKSMIYVQPMDVGDVDKNKANTELAKDLCLKYGYRLSIQLHKLVGLP